MDLAKAVSRMRRRHSPSRPYRGQNTTPRQGGLCYHPPSCPETRATYGLFKLVEGGSHFIPRFLLSPQTRSKTTRGERRAKGNFVLLQHFGRKHAAYTRWEKNRPGVPLIKKRIWSGVAPKAVCRMRRRQPLRGGKDYPPAGWAVLPRALMP